MIYVVVLLHDSSFSDMGSAVYMAKKNIIYA